MSGFLRPVMADQLLRQRRLAVDLETRQQSGAIVEDVRERGEVALREHAERLGDCGAADAIRFDRSQLDRALADLAEDDRLVLERTADRIRSFAEAQLACLLPLDTEVPGGRAGHRWLPVESVGAYAPGGRHPLPSSVLMTVIPARIAGVSNIVVASPKPTSVTLAAAALAGADGLLAVGGAQAIAALAFGTLAAPVDVIVGPGNRWVTAAKQHLVGEVGIDGLAGPSELMVLADDSADAGMVAADLLAQAEHDADAVPILVTTSARLVESVEHELSRQLASLPTAATALAAFCSNGVVALVDDLAQGVSVANRLAPEHLEICVRDEEVVQDRLTAYGSLFVGGQTAEVFGDYGAGPNHVLPTGGGSRFQAGLSVMTYLRPLTFLNVQDPRLIQQDAARLARMEGLEGHARSAQRR